MTMLLRRKIMQTDNKLPITYQEVSYLTSTSGAYIDLPSVTFNTNDSIRTQIKFQYLGTATNNFWVAGDGTPKGGVQYEYGVYGGWYWKSNTFSSDSVIDNVTQDTTMTSIIEVDWEHIYSSAAGNYNCRVFQRSGGYALETDKRNIYYFKFYKNNILLYNLIPCYRKLDEVPGMYDMVNHIFYTNIGPGEFIIGPEIIHEWYKTTYLATADTTRADLTTNAIKSVLPATYRWAIALTQDANNPENNAVLSMIFLPSRQQVHALRWRNSAYSIVGDATNSAYDLILRANTPITVLWRTEPINNYLITVPGWECLCMQPAPITLADELKNTLLEFSPFNILISIADLDFNLTPSVQYTYCDSIVYNSANFAGDFGRYNNGYQYQSGWTSTWGSAITEGTKIVSFRFS